MKAFYFFLGLLFLLQFTSCNSYKYNIIEYDLPQKNHTEFTFNYSARYILDKIKRFEKTKEIVDSDYEYSLSYYGENEYQYLCNINHLDSLKDGKYRNSYFFYPYPDYYSKKFYFENGDSILLETLYFIFLDEKEINKTKVSIKTINPRLILGYDKFIYFISGYSHTFLHYMDIDPSTIEEYELLYQMGRILDVNNSMPLVILPNKKFKKITKEFPY